MKKSLCVTTTDVLAVKQAGRDAKTWAFASVHILVVLAIMLINLCPLTKGSKQSII
jgi:hypothetical protein